MAIPTSRNASESIAAGLLAGAFWNRPAALPCLSIHYIPRAKQDEAFREEVGKEFRLDRMVQFSNAVFAILITMMAI